VFDKSQEPYALKAHVRICAGGGVSKSERPLYGDLETSFYPDYAQQPSDLGAVRIVAET